MNIKRKKGRVPMNYGMGGKMMPEYMGGGKMPPMYEKGGKPDFLDLDKDGDRKELMKNTYEMGGRMYQDVGKMAFNMMGQYTSPVQQDQNGEFVMYDDGSGKQMKVYGNWNEYAQGQDSEGNMFLPDEDFPVIQNDRGEFVLDEVTYDAQNRGYEATRNLGGQGASKMEDLMQRLSDMYGPNMTRIGGR